jgi:hypothetical protein
MSDVWPGITRLALAVASLVGVELARRTARFVAAAICHTWQWWTARPGRAIRVLRSLRNSPHQL